MTKTEVCEALERAILDHQRIHDLIDDDAHIGKLRALKERIERGVVMPRSGQFPAGPQTLVIDWSGREGEAG